MAAVDIKRDRRSSHLLQALARTLVASADPMADRLGRQRWNFDR